MDNYAGILPIAKSSLGKNDKFGVISNKPLGGFDEVEDKEVHKGNVLRSEFVNKGIEGFSQETTSKVVIEQGWNEFNSRRVLEKQFFDLSEGFFGWFLPGHGESYADCGSFWSKGCLHVEDHQQEGLFEAHAGMVFVKRIKRTCARAGCPICFKSWAGKEAEKIEWRLKEWKGRGRAIHLVASVPQKMWFKSFQELRREAYKWVKKANFWGGSCIWHPFRKSLDGMWYFSPHFHMIGYGWVRNTDKIYARSGWVIRNVGVRDSVGATAFYQLSHAGVHGKFHTVTWFGVLSYNKMRCRPLPEKESDKCPMCGRELVKVIWVGEGVFPLPDVEMGFYIDPGGWIESPIMGRFWR